MVRKVAGYLTIAEVAALSGVDPGSVYRWIDKGELRVWRVGGCLRTTPEEVARMNEPVPVEPRRAAEPRSRRDDAARKICEAWLGKKVTRRKGAAKSPSDSGTGNGSVT